MSKSILGGQGSKKMVGVGLRKVLDAKIVDSESERRATCFVSPETGSVGHGIVTMGGKVSNKLIVG